MAEQPQDYDDSSHNRRTSRIPSQGEEVVLHDAKLGVISGRTLDEAFGGLGVLVEQAPAMSYGQEADVFYNGMRMTAVVRHIGPHSGGVIRLGMAWKGAVLSQEARSAVQTRRERGLESDDPSYERFIRSIPGGVHTMWSLYESNSWMELSDSAGRLGKHARAADVDDLTPFIDRLQRFIAEDETYENVGKALEELIATATDACSCVDW